MKNAIYLGLSLLFLFTSNLIAQNVNIPDTNFKNKLLNHDPVIDTNGDSEIQITEAEGFFGNLDVSGTFSNPGGITDLTGLEAFISIGQFQANYNSITNLDVSMLTGLTGLTVNENPLTNVDVSNNSFLRTMSIAGHDLTSLNLTNNTALEFLQASFGPLETLDVSNNEELQFLYVNNTSLTELDLSNNINLIGARLEDTELMSLDTSNGATLDFLYCDGTNLKTLDVSENTLLRTLKCGFNNQLTYINIKSGNNDNIIISGGQSSNFESLPNLAIVCIDSETSALANFIEAQVSHPVQFIQNCTLGSEEYTQDQFLSIFPNPANELLQWRSSSSIKQLEVYSVNGQLLITEGFSSPVNSFDVSSLTSGLYFVKFMDDSQKEIVIKMLKK